MNRTVKVGIAQTSSLIGNIDKNLNKALEKINEAANKEADIICFPELYITGYNMDDSNIYSKKETFKNYNKIINKISSSALSNKIYVILPIAAEKNHKVYNSALLFNREGKILGNYDKVHLFEKERNNFERGNQFKVWETEIGKIGIMICYDAGFPESARILTLKGAELIFCPSAWRIQDKLAWDLNLAQRAYENTTFVIGVNSVTQTKSLHLFGNSKIIAPNGVPVAEAGVDTEEILVCEVDLDDIKKFRNQYPYLKHRIPSLYKEITK